MADDPAYDLGQGAGFCVDAMQAPWSAHFRMESWVSGELPAVTAERFAVDTARCGISGHSMGGHCASLLVEGGAARGHYDSLLVDQGDQDGFLTSQLKPELLEAACASAGQPLQLRRQAGYDHSYFVISTFIADHLAWHAARLS